LLFLFVCSFEALEALVAERQVCTVDLTFIRRETKYTKIHTHTYHTNKQNFQNPSSLKQNPNDPPMKNQSLVHQLTYEVEEKRHTTKKTKKTKKKNLEAKPTTTKGNHQTRDKRQKGGTHQKTKQLRLMMRRSNNALMLTCTLLLWMAAERRRKIKKKKQKKKKQESASLRCRPAISAAGGAEAKRTLSWEQRVAARGGAPVAQRGREVEEKNY